MAADIYLSDGTVVMLGTDFADQIVVESKTLRMPSRFGAITMEVVEAQILDEAGNEIERSVFSASVVDRIWADGGGGNDVIRNKTDLPSDLFGGSGHDLIQGGASTDVIRGGSGHDSLYGRGGLDYLLGESGNDGLYGGDSLDFLYGGSGANRFLVESEAPDRLYHVDGNDATLWFRDGGLINNEYLGIYSPGKWAQEEIELVDRAFERLHEATGNTRLLKKANGDSMTFIRQGHKWFESSDVAAWNTQGEISVTDKAFDHPWYKNFDQDELHAQAVILHEIGHNWDELSENVTVGAFRSISGWHTVAGTWVIDNSSEFPTPHSQSNPLEDFAEHFAMYFMDEEYFYLGVSESPEKMEYMEFFVDDINAIYFLSNM